jgi:ribonuclease III
MARDPRPEAVAERLGYAFEDLDLLRQALTPPSAGPAAHNQRLEFLGDALLHACMALLIYREKPTWDEGRMSKLRGMLVNATSLRDWAEDLGLELLRGPRTPRKAPEGIRKPVSDAMEALLAAVYLDAEARGREGFPQVLRVVAGRFAPTIRAAVEGIWEGRDTKTTLQERVAALGLPAPSYELVGRSGPDHEPSFRVRVSVGDRVAEAEATSLKRAQVEAARLLLADLGRPA